MCIIALRRQKYKKLTENVTFFRFFFCFASIFSYLCREK